MARALTRRSGVPRTADGIRTAKGKLYDARQALKEAWHDVKAARLAAADDADKDIFF